ncbi:sensor histidine kinase [Anaerotignum sp.]|uniref:sensor histidine kinase n=1 Tax=Anaerotignum sp. TaxID=2039241 RepID=UPI0028B02BC8|nr:sensor histidine kinase [Anaerotignum sp.]
MSLKNRFKEMVQQWMERRGRRPELKQVIWFSFTATAMATALIMGISFYGRFLAQIKDTFREENQFLMEQASYSFSNHLRNMMKVSDSLYYSVIKKTDMEIESVTDSFQLMYDTNKDHIERIALFSMDGRLLESAPAGKMSKGTNIKKEDWYWDTLASEENICLGKPEVAHLFEPSRQEYTRVVPMTRIVQMTVGDHVERGILLIQLKHNDFQDVFSNILLGGGSYLYLTDADGEIIYHPQQELVKSGYVEEAIDLNSIPSSGIVKNIGDKQREYFVKTVGYTGWKIIGVTQTDGIALNTFKSSMFIAFLTLFFLSIIVVINSFLSKRVSAPMGRLEEAVNRIEAGNLDTDIEPSGFYEVWHLGRAIDKMKNNLKRLMEDIVKEHEAKRKSELMALQNQINPHFLYNTLDIIVWMIENGKKDDAVNVVTALARFFRISLSRGCTVITVQDEVEHVRNYLMIQEMRFKNRFSYEFHLEDGVETLGTIKLILQPIVENAVYHAMEFMDGDGEIKVSVFRQGEDLYFLIQDNGCGMTQEQVEKLMNGMDICSGKGAGVGLRNVRERIRLVFGDSYDLSIVSEPDEGTEVRVKIPAISYDILRQRGLD